MLRTGFPKALKIFILIGVQAYLARLVQGNLELQPQNLLGVQAYLALHARMFLEFECVTSVSKTS